MGPPLHSFVVCAEELHPIEEEMFDFYRIKKEAQREQQQLQ